MNFYVIIEPLVRNQYWSSQYTEGMKQEIQRSKGKYIEITLDDLEEVIKGSASVHTRPVVLINCVSNTWIPQCLLKLDQQEIHPLLLTPAGQSITSSVSTVSFDFYNAFYSLCGYLKNAGRQEVALFGLNPTSANDMVKQRAFIDFCKSNSREAEHHIYRNHGNLEECCSDFYRNIHRYNSIVCVNDIVAIKLISFLKDRNVSIPENIYLAAMGNTFLSKMIVPNITVAEFDCFSIGRQAVKVYSFLTRNPDISALTATVSGQIIVRASTAGILPCQNNHRAVGHADSVNFYADNDVKGIFILEELLENIDKLDRQIIYGLLCDNKISALAEALFISESAVKYRIKRMFGIAGCETRTAFVTWLTQYMEYIEFL